MPESYVLKHFVSGIARKTVVVDPDELFRDEGLYTEISRRGFSLLHFEDSVSFRFTYESEFREAWDILRQIQSWYITYQVISRTS